MNAAQRRKYRRMVARRFPVGCKVAVLRPVLKIERIVGEVMANRPVWCHTSACIYVSFQAFDSGLSYTPKALRRLT